MQTHPSFKEIKGAVFDLDGVITKTMIIHAKAWKQMFDEYFKEYNKFHAAKQPPLDIEKEYPPYIDGIPREDGVRNLLKHRGIILPEGTIDDPPGRETIWGLSNKKLYLFTDLVNRDGVETYPATINKIYQWRKLGIRTAVISSSQSCCYILDQSGILHLFDAVVDGKTSKDLNLKGKPHPDIFLEAAHQIQSPPEQSIAIEDATSGVEAAKRALYHTVIGINRQNQEQALYHHGADIVVSSLKEIK
ncbi:MAG: HAD-IA family hydrolase [Bacteroidota bacterium]